MARTLRGLFVCFIGVASAAHGSRGLGQEALRVEPVPQILAGDCAITSDATVRCWSPGREERPIPGPFVSITADSNNYCGVRPNGEGVCWGNGRGGAPQSARILPGRFKSLSFTGPLCGIRPDASVECLAVPGQTPRSFAGRYAKVEFCGTSWYLLREDGAVESVAVPGQERFARPKPEGRFIDIDCFQGVRVDGTLVGVGLYAANYPPEPGPFLSTRGLRADGQFGRDRHLQRGPFVEVSSNCGVLVDGRIRGDECKAPKDLVLAVPEALKNRITPRPSIPQKLGQLSDGRAAEGTPKQYRVALAAWDGDHNLYISKKGARLVSEYLPNAGPEGSLYSSLNDESAFTLVDLNGGDLEFNDALHLKVNKSYVAVDAKGIALAAKPGSTTRWTLHTAGIVDELTNGRKAETRIDPYAGVYGIWLRAPTGEFLVGSGDQVNIKLDALERYGFRRITPDGGAGPFWITDPSLENLEAPHHDKLFALRATQWVMWPVVDCDTRLPHKPNKTIRGPCALITSRANAHHPKALRDQLEGQAAGVGRR